MRILLTSCIALLIISCKKKYTEPPLSIRQDDTTNLISYNKNLTVANWNIEWFGSSKFGGNLNVQEVNAGKVLKYLNADIYGICEVVDTGRFGRIIRTVLGNEYRYQISAYGNFEQKMAFVYNRNIFRKVTVRPFMNTSIKAAENFAGGRFPFLLTADIVINGQRTSISFILLHAKANADLDSYTKRLNGSIEMKDSLDTYFGDKHFIVFGDYNDNLNSSIYNQKLSPYKNFVDDHVRYNAITYPLNTNGYQSTLGFTNSVIDQQIISSNMTQWYVESSIKIRTDITAVVPDYTSHNTSDHYPVSSVYSVK